MTRMLLWLCYLELLHPAVILIIMMAGPVDGLVSPPPLRHHVTPCGSDYVCQLNIPCTLWHEIEPLLTTSIQAAA